MARRPWARGLWGRAVLADAVKRQVLQRAAGGSPPQVKRIEVTQRDAQLRLRSVPNGRSAVANGAESQIVTPVVWDNREIGPSVAVPLRLFTTLHVTLGTDGECAFPALAYALRRTPIQSWPRRLKLAEPAGE